jgi:FAD-dependent urate hydroxylase
MKPLSEPGGRYRRGSGVRARRGVVRAAAGSQRVAVIGAGPHGLATAAFLRQAGVSVRTFGEPLGFWRRNMPRGMLLRGRRRSSHLPDPGRDLTIEAYESATGRRLSSPIRLEEFIGYGDWYQRLAVPEVDSRRVVEVSRTDGGFSIVLDDSGTVHATHVVVAAGTRAFARRPPPFADLPLDLVSHSSDHHDVERFGGKRVVVVGAGQSALELAALLAASDANVEVVARAASLRWLRRHEPNSVRTKVREVVIPPTDLGGWVTGWVAATPDLLRRLPGRAQTAVGRRCTAPAAADWLWPRLSRASILLGRTVTAAAPLNGGIEVTLDDRSERRAEHVILGTGYRVDVSDYTFLSREITTALERVGGYPRLAPGYESSVPGLHFVGAPAAYSFGPLMQFIVGSWHAAPAVTRQVLGSRQPAVRLSYKPRVALNRSALG